ncbi:MAG TPA: DNA mismatch repair protein MutS, partial [Bacteroidia bacterium]|nr:DNA mismatch repair protein MutS [Bacteroidia bacterium]
YWDVFCLKALEKWKQELGERIVEWFEVIGEMEALNSLAAMRFAFPAWTDAEIVEGSFLLEGQAIGHPLIPPQQRIANPISLTGNGAIWLVTGSNMSGKSTYLRTVGLNAVLALMGAPVCATNLRLSPMEVVTSMRTIDSLEENTSSFYAELKRLQTVIQVVQTHPNVLFLLDEILKGTNSRDRQAGARALVHQLHLRGGSGLVSTHDIELVDMAGEMPQDIHNYSFNCIVTPEGQLHFDYTLTPGQCLSMNATALMRAMGIDV